VTGEAEPGLLERCTELVELVREAGGIENLSDGTQQLLVLVADHVRETTMLARRRRREAGAAGFDVVWGLVSNVVQLGGVAFADDVVAGVAPSVAAERHGASSEALAAATEYAEVVRFIRDDVTATEALALMERAEALASLDPEREVDETPTPALRWVRRPAKPRERTRPGHGWPVTSLAPPVAV
jgi:hypothetical protein